jgi:hypothetical protein
LAEVREIYRSEHRPRLPEKDHQRDLAGENGTSIDIAPQT